MFKKISLVLLSIVIIAGIAGVISYKLFYKKVEGVTDINSKIISTPTQTPELQPTKEPTQQTTAKPKPVYQSTSEPTPEPTNTQNPPSNSQNQTDYNNCVQIAIDNYNKSVAESNRSTNEYLKKCDGVLEVAACKEEMLKIGSDTLKELETMYNNGITYCAAHYPH